MKRILVRFDDICPTMDWNEWKRAMDILTLHHVKPLLGVIPENRDPDLRIAPPRKDFWEYLIDLQAQGFAIAMHGYIHLYDTSVRGIVNDTFHSEFAGHTYDEQYEKIRKGKEILAKHGIETDIFFAPSHSYDTTTLEALAANGFRYVIDGKSIKPMKRKGVICIPLGTPKSDYYVEVFHAHEWVRPDKADGYASLKKLCEEHEDSIVDMPAFLSRPLGNPLVQLLSEKISVVFDRNIKPVLRPLYHLIKGGNK